MEEIFIDSNVFLRFYASDDAGQGDLAEELFRRAARNEIGLVTGPPVFFEVAWTLKAWAKWPNAKILDTLQAMTAIPNMRLIDKDTVISAILLAKAAGQEFADSYIAATVRERGIKLMTFNHKHFMKLKTPLYTLSGKK
jgi:predicted nucleic acid-binding protein